MTHNSIAIQPATHEHTYELHGTYFDYDLATGAVIGRNEVVGQFVRRPAPGGQCADAFEWLNCRAGNAASRDEPIADWREMSFAQGFAYTFNFEAELDRFPIDVSSIPRDFDGWFFYVHILDTHNQFDILRTRRYGKADELNKPGDSVVRDHSEHFELEDWSPMFRSRFDRSSKINVTTWTGVGEYAGHAANVLYYRCDDVPMQVETPAAEMRMMGMTNYHGHIYLDHETGTLLGGDLFEYVILTSSYQHREVYLKLLK
jgi:hypothetical protein